jgi:hypothetical protein
MIPIDCVTGMCIGFSDTSTVSENPIPVIFKPLILLAFTMPALPVDNSNEPLSLRFAKAPRRCAA